ncbi:MAG TPA: hypothetical protein VF755_04925 [Catenuloplanes sp.]
MNLLPRLATAVLTSTAGTMLCLPTGGAVAALPDPAGGLRFDFGSATSPVAEGYLQVANTTGYDTGRGYGLDRVVAFRDRGAPDPLRRDFTVGPAYTFSVDLPAGDHHVTVISGDQSANSTTSVSAEGAPRGTILSPAGRFSSLRTVVTVTDGRLDLTFGRDGRVNAVEVVPLPRPTGLLVTGVTVTGRPAVALRWTPVAGAARYRVHRAASADGPFTAIAEPTTSGFTDHAAELGLSYVYAVSQVNGDGLESSRGDTVAATVRDPSVAPPGTPRGVALERTTARGTTLRWLPAAQALRYYVYRAEAAGGPFEKIATSEDRRYTDPTPPHRAFFYRVYAVATGGLSAAGPVVTSPVTHRPPRQQERLDRGLVAVPTGTGTLVSWRLLGTDPDGVTFHVYRDGRRVAGSPVTGATNLLDPAGGATSAYTVAAVVGGRETARSAAVRPWAAAHLDIPLQRPPDATTPDGKPFTYHANDVSTGDLDGDGRYELVVKWDPSNSHDNSVAGYTGEVFLDAYTLDGTRLWRIAMGRNIRAGAHYTQFLVYDLDGDGRAEVVAKTADGTTDGAGTVIGDPAADHRNSTGYVLTGAEYLTVFDGRDGKALTTTDYQPGRGDPCDWGDCYGNRVDRFLAGVAYLDGERPSFVMARGYYTRTVLAAYDWRAGKLTRRWTFDSAREGNGDYAGQGNHNLSVGDVDNDGRDEIVYGAMALDDDGTGLWNTRLGHGDALHLGDLDPARPGLEVFGVHENPTAAHGMELRDAATGAIHWGRFTGIDTGRGTAADIDPNHPGAEAWAVDGEWNSPTGNLYAASGTRLSTAIPAANFAVWWDGDLSREILDHDFDVERGVGVGTIGEWDPATGRTANLLTATGTLANNGTKGNPGLQADLLGDWREEVIWRTADSSALRLYATTTPSAHRIRTLMHDPVYRLGVAWQNVGYNQPPHTSFFLGTAMATPPAPHLRTGPVIAARVVVRPGVWLAGTGHWRPPVTAGVTLPPGSAAVATDTVRLLVDGALVAPRHSTAVTGPSGQRQLLVWFDGAALAGAVGDHGGQVDLTLTGHLVDGGTFAGGDSVHVVGRAG